MKTLVILLLLSCNTTVKEQKEFDKPVVIYVNDDGSTTVFTRYDSSATVVNLTKDGVLVDSMWMLVKPGISNDSLIKNYYRMIQGSKHQ